jgi:hypothetical protein
LDLPPDKKEEISQSIAERIAKGAGSSATLETIHPDSKLPSISRLSADYLVTTLGQRLARELNQDPNVVLQALALGTDEPLFTPAIPMTSGYSVYNAQRPLPSRQQAQEWLNVFLSGPNAIFPIIDPLESQRHLDALYSSEHELPASTHCCIYFQIAIGARFTEDTPEHVYLAWYEKARIQMEYCVDYTEEKVLWVVRPMLLSIIFAINMRPRMSWLTLGKQIAFSTIPMPNFRVRWGHSNSADLSY